MQELIAHLINKAYRFYQGKIFLEKETATSSYFLEFGGFQLNYNWYGRSRISKELIGKLAIYKKDIHLDSRFLYKLANLRSSDDNYMRSII